MSTIDVRTQSSEEVLNIIFAQQVSSCSSERTDLVYKLNKHDMHKGCIFIEAQTGEYVAVRKTDLDNLIKALQQAKKLGWDQ